MIVIIILGPQGSGKGTQAQKLAKKYNIPHVSTGDIFRENIKNKTELGQKVSKIINSGNMVPDELTFEVLKDRLSQPDCEKGYILDGYPRNINQAKLLDNFSKINYAVDVQITDKEAIFRIGGRRTCPDNHVYHIKFNPPKEEGKCDIDGKELYQRDDDKEETIRKRLGVYHEQTKPLTDFYKASNILIEINGAHPIDKVFDDILEKLSE